MYTGLQNTLGREINMFKFRFLFKIQLYLLIIAVFLSPYFTPPIFLRSGSFIIGEGGIVRLDQLLMPILLMSLIMVMIWKRRQIKTVISTGPILYLFMFIIINLGVFYGVFFRGYAFRIGDLYDGVLWLCYSLLVMTLPLALTLEEAEKALSALLIAGIVASLIAVTQSPFYSPEIFVDFYTNVLSQFYPTQERAVAPSRNPNVLGQMLIAPLFILMGLLVISLRQKNIQKAIYVILFVFVVSFAIFSTGSRSTMVSIFPGIFAMVVFLLTTSDINTEGYQKTSRQFILLLLILSSAMFLFLLTGPGFGRFEDLTRENLLGARAESWPAAIQLIKEGLIIGHGTSGEGLVHYQEQYGFIDSGILQILFRHGFTGFITMTLIIFWSMRVAVSTLQETAIMQKYPFLWSGSLALTGLCVSMISMWPIRRLEIGNASQFFMIFVLLTIFVYVSKFRHTRQDGN